MERWHCEILDPEQLDKKELLGFIQEEYGQSGPAQPDYFDWYCLHNPAGRAVVPTVRDPDSGKLIGQYWLIPLRAEIDGQRHTGVLGVNALVHRDYRQQGVMRAIRPHTAPAMRECGVEFSISFPNPGMVKATRTYQDSYLIGPLDMLVRPLDWSLLDHTRLGGLPLQSALQASARAVWPLLFRPRSVRDSKSGLKVHQAPDYGPAFDDFWDRVGGKYPAMFTRDAAFMRWRYQHHPRHRYTTLLAWDGARLAGYITLYSAEIRGFRLGAIVDFLVEPSERGEEAGDLLVAKAIRHFQARRLHLAACLMGPKTVERRILQRHGFVALPQALHPQPVLLAFRAYVDTLPMSIIGDIHSWHITLGDFDIM
jgi:GNAT superfamily N-acetyltransferase